MPFLTCTLSSILHRLICGIYSFFSRLFNHQPPPPPAPGPSPDLESRSSAPNPTTPCINAIRTQIQTRIPTQTLLTIPETTFTTAKTKLTSPRTKWRNTCFEEAYEEQTEQSRRLGEMLLEAREELVRVRRERERRLSQVDGDVVEEGELPGYVEDRGGEVPPVYVGGGERVREREMPPVYRVGE